MSRWKHIPWILAVIWFIFRWTYGASLDYDFEKGRNAGVLANILGILLVLFVNLVARHRTGQSAQSSFLTEVRAGMTQSLKYVAAVSVFMTIYYIQVSDELDRKRLHDYAVNSSLVDTEEELAQVRSANENLKGMSAEAILKSANARTDLMTGKGFVLSSSFIGLVFTSLLYAFIGTFLFRNYLRSK